MSIESSARLEEMSGELLVRRASAGDGPSFDELARRGRAAAHRLAAAICRDPHLAEDIVQDALLQAYVKLPDLQDPAKFDAWLRRIVRNEALARLRQASRTDGRARADSHDAESAAAIGANPESALLHAEAFEDVRRLMPRLKPKERAVLAASAVRQMTPQKIAAKEGMTPANVYATLSRARGKLYALQRQQLLTRYLAERRKAGMPVCRLLEPKGIYFGEIWDSFALCVLHALQYEGIDRYTMADVMGLSGQAFRLQLDRRMGSFVMPSMTAWGKLFASGLSHLGVTPRWLAEGNRDPLRLQLHVEALAFIQRSIDRGAPALIWGVFLPYFGWVSGYDDASRTIRISGMFGHERLPYDRLAIDSGAGEALFVMSIGSVKPIREADALRGALHAVVRHLSGQDAAGEEGSVTGLAAYDAWIGLLTAERDVLEQLTNLVWTASSNRAYAASFLAGVASAPAGRYGMADEAVKPLAQEAASRYQDAADTLWKLRQWYPYALHSTCPPPEGRAAACAALLAEAQAHERRALPLLEAMAACLDAARDSLR